MAANDGDNLSVGSVVMCSAAEIHDTAEVRAQEDAGPVRA
jgi:hypothetical protein